MLYACRVGDGERSGNERERFGRGRRETFKRVREADAAKQRSARARAALSELDVCV